MKAYSINPRSAKLLETLSPYAKPILTEALNLAHKNGLNMQVHSAYRSPAEQQEIYNQGRSKPGKIVTNAKGIPEMQSMHGYRVAIDTHFDQNEDGVAEWDPALYKKVWDLCVAAGLDKKGLRWAGSWVSFKETCHWEVSFGKTWTDFSKGFNPSAYSEPKEPKKESKKK